LYRIHFIAIGGAAMHNLAIALNKKGYQVTGSDDEIFEPSRSQLEKYGLLPMEYGWFPSKLSKEIDAIILGMHAKPDNPELIRARELGLKIYSYPEYLYEQTKNKTRVVIAGSHGKTTITAILIHVLHCNNITIDFMVGSKIEGFDTMVALNDESEIAVFEGDEYLSSPLDRRPKFLHYKPHIALISGIAWDHFNVFPTFNNYIQQFRKLIENVSSNGHIVFFEGDENVKKLTRFAHRDVQFHPYTEHGFIYDRERISLVTSEEKEIPVQIFGRHNMQNINGAKIICTILGLSDEQFYKALAAFPGTAKRLQILEQRDSYTCFLDFAHSPSKVKATLQAVRERFPDRKLYAILELHTFSSLNKAFIPNYKGTMDDADEAIVFYDENVLINKNLEMIPTAFIKKCFRNPKVNVMSKKEYLETYLKQINKINSVLLLMSSGNFGGLSITQI